MRLGEIASHMGGRLLGDDGFAKGLNPLYAAGPEDLSVLAWPKDIRLAKRSLAAALIIPSDWAADHADELSMSLIVIDDLALAFQTLAALCTQGYLGRELTITQKHIHNSALISKSSQIASAHIGANTSISPQVVIEDDVAIGAHCLIGPGVIIHRGTRIGDHCVLGAHTVIGGAAFAPFGLRCPQLLVSLGHVNIGNHVRIGALCTIDRGLLGATRIENYCHLDSQVHIGHDSRVGKDVIIAAQSGLAGFVRIGSEVSIGGQSGVGPHVQIGRGARVSGKTFVHKNLRALAICSGNPGLPHELYLRAYKQKLTNKSGFPNERV